jgi:GDPmannose 4,6-dehydratase
VGTGESHSVRDFVQLAFDYAGIDLEWTGQGVAEQGIVRSLRPDASSALKTGAAIVAIDPRYFRPTEVTHLQADITKARKKLGWEPRTSFEELVKIMVDYDLKTAGINPRGEGIKASQSKGFTYTNHDFALHERISENCT